MDSFLFASGKDEQGSARSSRTPLQQLYHVPNSFQADLATRLTLVPNSLNGREPKALPASALPRQTSPRLPRCHCAIMALPKRIIKETERLIAEPVPGISAVPHEDNLRYFDVSIHGPSQSPYEGGIFKLELFLPEDYPMTPPKIRFLTKIYHPNIDKLGRICLDVLKSNWSPALQIRTILLSIQALLGAPNPDDPLANDVAQRWKEDEPAAIQTARDWTRTHAMT